MDTFWTHRRETGLVMPRKLLISGAPGGVEPLTLRSEVRSGAEAAKTRGKAQSLCLCSPLLFSISVRLVPCQCGNKSGNSRGTLSTAQELTFTNRPATPCRRACFGCKEVKTSFAPEVLFAFADGQTYDGGFRVKCEMSRD